MATNISHKPKSEHVFIFILFQKQYNLTSLATSCTYLANTLSKIAVSDINAPNPAKLSTFVINLTYFLMLPSPDSPALHSGQTPYLVMT